MPRFTAAQDERLAELLDELARKTASGEVVEIEHAAACHPDLASELRSLWATMQFTGDFLSLAALDLDAIDASGQPAARPLTNLHPVPFSPGPTELPRRFGEYELLEELGRGGMGVVYRARQPGLDRTVALKRILRGELASPEDRERFRTEATAAAQLTHPHVVPVYEVGEAEGEPFFSMQFIAGETLARRLTSGPLGAREAATLLVPIGRAVADAHRQGVLHRDLKPSNILIDSSGRPYVTDFGLAKRIDTPALATVPQHSPRSITQSGALLGTPGYMAPEQAAGDRGRVGPATDIYALGAILYAMLTGRAPFQAASPIDTVLMVLEQDPPPPRLLNPGVDTDLEMIALKSLQKPTDLRYATADELADDLERFLRHEPVSARSSHFSQVLSRAFRPTHHAAVLENWGRLWMLHSVVVLLLCLVTNGMQLSAERRVSSVQSDGVAAAEKSEKGRRASIEPSLPPHRTLNAQHSTPPTPRWTYVLLWTVGLGAWAWVFWELRRRAGPVTFVERQIAHIWAASMACSTGLFIVEWLLGLPALTLSPVLALVAGAVFVAKAGILSGEFYLHAALLFATAVPMALVPRYAVSMFGVMSFVTFFWPGWKFDRQRRRAAAAVKTVAT